MECMMSCGDDDSVRSVIFLSFTVRMKTEILSILHVFKFPSIKQNGKMERFRERASGVFTWWSH